PITPSAAEEKGREASAGRTEALLARFALALAHSHRAQRGRLQPAHRGAFGERGHQTVGQGRGKKPQAEQQGLGGRAPDAPRFGGWEEVLNAVFRRGSEKGVDIG